MNVILSKQKYHIVKEQSVPGKRTECRPIYLLTGMKSFQMTNMYIDLWHQLPWMVIETPFKMFMPSIFFWCLYKSKPLIFAFGNKFQYLNTDFFPLKMFKKLIYLYPLLNHNCLLSSHLPGKTSKLHNSHPLPTWHLHIDHIG